MNKAPFKPYTPMHLRRLSYEIKALHLRREAARKGMFKKIKKVFKNNKKG